MAEIRIQKKRRAVWPWILLLLIIIIAAAWFLLRDNEYIKETAADILPDSASLKISNLSPSDSKTEDFVDFVEDSGSIANLQAYTKEGLNRLSESLNSIIEENDLKRSLDNKGNSLRMTVTNINMDSGIQQIKGAFLAAADLMNSMQQEKFKGLNHEVSEVKKIAESLSTAQSMQAQKNKIRDFFSTSGLVVQKMNN